MLGAFGSVGQPFLARHDIERDDEIAGSINERAIKIESWDRAHVGEA